MARLRPCMDTPGVDAYRSPERGPVVADDSVTQKDIGPSGAAASCADDMREFVVGQVNGGKGAGCKLRLGAFELVDWLDNRLRASAAFETCDTLAIDGPNNDKEKECGVEGVYGSAEGQGDSGTLASPIDRQVTRPGLGRRDRHRRQRRGRGGRGVGD